MNWLLGKVRVSESWCSVRLSSTLHVNTSTPNLLLCPFPAVEALSWHISAHLIYLRPSFPLPMVVQVQVFRKHTTSVTSRC